MLNSNRWSERRNKSAAGAEHHIQNGLIILMAQEESPFQYEPVAVNHFIREALPALCTRLSHAAQPKALVSALLYERCASCPCLYALLHIKRLNHTRRPQFRWDPNAKAATANLQAPALATHQLSPVEKVYL